MEIAGLPLHPLIVHLVVVVTPLVGLAAIAYALVPRWRWWLRPVLVGLTLIAVTGAVLAAKSGQTLLADRPFLKTNANVLNHIQAGTNLRNAMLAFTAIVLGAAWRLGGPSGLASGRGARTEHPRNYVDLGLVALLAIGGVVVIIAAVLAGHSGAVAVWTK